MRLAHENARCPPPAVSAARGGTAAVAAAAAASGSPGWAPLGVLGGVLVAPALAQEGVGLVVEGLAGGALAQRRGPAAVLAGAVVAQHILQGTAGGGQSLLHLQL